MLNYVKWSSSPRVGMLLYPPFVNKRHPSVYEEVESSSSSLDPSNMHTFYQQHPSDYQWTKARLLEQILGDPSKQVMTRSKLGTDAEMCAFALTLSLMEPKNIKEAMVNHNRIEAMQDELHQFQRLNVWELVEKPSGKNINRVKWVWKNKTDAENIVIHNKASLVAQEYK
ncbi:hypothetical protein Tco_0519127 [Tanacetum coccineum]